MYEKVCPQCLKPFVTDNEQRVYCCETCAKKFRYNRAKKAREEAREKKTVEKTIKKPVVKEPPVDHLPGPMKETAALAREAVLIGMSYGQYVSLKDEHWVRAKVAREKKRQADRARRKRMKEKKENE